MKNSEMEEIQNIIKEQIELTVGREMNGLTLSGLGCSALWMNLMLVHCERT